MTSAANSMPNTPGSYNPHQVPTSFAQQLATPQNFSDASQSAPTSPQAQNNYDAQQMQQQWTPTRHYSASPDAMDIPNIVLTGADGTLDCFQDLEGLHLDNEIQQLLSNGEQQVDPACENQLVN
ncbi:hypothetical protein AAVH_39974 [Aphelenchoides avenae]|nr:hypothetical protein AAVH_39974 [Aphelenchus avenae]